MNPEEKIGLLSSLSLLQHVPKDRLASLANYLRTENHKSKTVIFEEGSKGDGLYFVASGHVLIRKKMTLTDGSSSHKDLATLSPGHLIGEMTLFEDAPRSAQALASDDCVLLKLGKDEISKWLKANPAIAVDFLIGMVQVLSRRLRRSSSELTSLFDISQWIVEPIATSREFLQKCLSHLVPHLEGSWSAGAYLYNEFSQDLELMVSEGNFDKVAAKLTMPKPNPSADTWLDVHTYLVPLPGKNRIIGYLIFNTSAKLSPQEQEECAMLLTTSSRLIASTIENLQYRTEEALRARLSSNREQYGSGF